jgi:hypothetical protein
MIYVLNLRDRESIPFGYKVINTTDTSKSFGRGLSPMFVGPVKANGIICKNVENAWQYSKVYYEHVDQYMEPKEEYFKWRNNGYRKKKADRYPMGKGRVPLYYYWEGKKLTQIEARVQIYIPLYANAVVKTDAFKKLKKLYEKTQHIVLLDYDSYNHRDLGLTWEEVINDPKRKMGHAFVLAMLLENYIKIIKV